MLKNLQFRGELLEYEVRGEGLPVMLVHGFTEDRQIWDPVLAGLSEKYFWIIPDLPGSGRSFYNSILTKIQDFTGVIQAILEQEQVSQIVLIGHSMGGYISLAFAEKFPEKILALGLFHSSSYADTREKKEARERNVRFIEKNGALPFTDQAIPGLFSEAFRANHPEEIRKLTERYANFTTHSLVQYLEAMKQRPATTDLLRMITKPVLFIMGEEDKAIPIQDSLEQCHLPQISYIHILTRTAHMGMIENTSLCNAILDRFLEQIPI